MKNDDYNNSNNDYNSSKNQDNIKNGDFNIHKIEYNIKIEEYNINNNNQNNYNNDYNINYDQYDYNINTTYKSNNNKEYISKNNEYNNEYNYNNNGYNSNNNNSKNNEFNNNENNNNKSNNNKENSILNNESNNNKNEFNIKNNEYSLINENEYNIKNNESNKNKNENNFKNVENEYRIKINESNNNDNKYNIKSNESNNNKKDYNIKINESNNNKNEFNININEYYINNINFNISNDLNQNNDIINTNKNLTFENNNKNEFINKNEYNYIKDFSNEIKINNEFNKNNEIITSQYNISSKISNSSQEIDPGSNFNLSEFTIIKEIGKGTEGTIYSVNWKKNNKKYALKKGKLRDLELVKKRQEEIMMLKNFRNNTGSDGVIKIYGDVCNNNKYGYYDFYEIMELADKDWEQEILDRGNLHLYYEESELLEIMSQLVKTLSLLQKNHITHRDIKPQNIMIVNGKFKICDFGNARILKREGMVVQRIRGSELYMSPIMFKGYHAKMPQVKHHTFKSDVFSLGMCFFLAAAISYTPLNIIREIYDMNEIKKVINHYVGERYSRKIFKILFSMLQVEEQFRPDFIQLESFFSNIQNYV